MKYLLLCLLALITQNTIALTITDQLGTHQFEQPPQRVITLDWALTETALSLGIEPLGVADAQGYQEWVSFPVLPNSSVDVGARSEPNLELISQLKPDVILISPYLLPALDKLQKIAPTLVFGIYEGNKQPIANAQQVTLAFGQLFDRQAQAQAVIEQTSQILSQNGARLSATVNAPLLFLRVLSPQTLRIHGQGAMVNDTIERMGLKNSWQEKTNVWGFSTAEVAQVAAHQSAKAMLFGPLKASEKEAFFASPLWQAMAFTRTDNVYELPAIWTFGGLISAQRFSDQLLKLLLPED
ncbi:ABC transporter substrate-binding protein [Marinomonas fungiae]|uniref:ABC-type Fe3+-hydroxamate transport system, periplasmic component n=1 Tax=Marinomonas fungiae TaxID=1137284 RepID=A0A0K6IQR8_9GAMM|nr:ABC transporter substrate-binding protein [Marinomonas fungiae]CUB05460.1 ABC-type Fe3+-hydroxamate transport system, periplasmic component [Marinomonas fungiae]